jgi:hypothetical protein
VLPQNDINTANYINPLGRTTTTWYDYCQFGHAILMHHHQKKRKEKREKKRKPKHTTKVNQQIDIPPPILVYHLTHRKGVRATRQLDRKCDSLCFENHNSHSGVPIRPLDRNGHPLLHQNTPSLSLPAVT